MVVELYTSTRPGKPRRALVASVILLASACALAGLMTLGRSGGARSSRIELPGWAISFQPPPSFRNDQFGLTPLGTAYRCDTLTPDGALVILTAYRVETGGTTDPGVVCYRVLRRQLGLRMPFVGVPPITWFDKKLGPLDAVQVWDQLSGGLIVRAAVLPSGEAYAVTLAVQGDISPELYRLFEATCESVEHQRR